MVLRLPVPFSNKLFFLFFFLYSSPGKFVLYFSSPDGECLIPTSGKGYKSSDLHSLRGMPLQCLFIDQNVV